MYLRLRRPSPSDEQPPGAADRGGRRRWRWPSSRSSSSASGTCRCSPARSTWPRRTTTAPASSASPPRAATSSTATARRSSTTAPAWRCRSTRRSCRRLPAHRQAELARLGALAHMSPRQVRATMHEQLKLAAGAPVTLRRDVGYDLVYYLQENQDRFPGVQVQRVFVRHYPDGTLAAHVLGSVGEVNEEQLKEPRYRRLRAGRRGRPGRGRVHLRSLPARAARPHPHPGQRARAADPGRAAGLQAAGPRRQPQAFDRLLGAGSGRTGARRPRPARRLRDDERRTTARSSGWAPSRPSTRASSPNR